MMHRVFPARARKYKCNKLLLILYTGPFLLRQNLIKLFRAFRVFNLESQRVSDNSRAPCIFIFSTSVYIYQFAIRDIQRAYVIARMYIDYSYRCAFPETGTTLECSCPCASLSSVISRITASVMHTQIMAGITAVRSFRVQGSAELAAERPNRPHSSLDITSPSRTYENEAAIALVLVKRQAGACKTRRRVALVAPLKRVSLCLITHLAYAKQRQP